MRWQRVLCAASIFWYFEERLGDKISVTESTFAYFRLDPNFPIAIWEFVMLVSLRGKFISSKNNNRFQVPSLI
jgi:hypothetical protein